LSENRRFICWLLAIVHAARGNNPPNALSSPAPRCSARCSPLRLAFAGTLLATLVASAVAKVIASLLFATSPLDLLTYLGMVAALPLVAAVSGYILARRASSINPTEALRSN